MLSKLQLGLSLLEIFSYPSRCHMDFMKVGSYFLIFNLILETLVSFIRESKDIECIRMPRVQDQLLSTVDYSRLLRSIQCPNIPQNVLEAEFCLIIRAISVQQRRHPSTGPFCFLHIRYIALLQLWATFQTNIYSLLPPKDSGQSSRREGTIVRWVKTAMPNYCLNCIFAL